MRTYWEKTRGKTYNKQSDAEDEFDWKCFIFYFILDITIIHDNLISWQPFYQLSTNLKWIN